MASIIEGYQYDIFISYRQKDNKGDRWVSQFVDALKTEIESTFKENVSVYFDENPHDRLQETHHVSKSLEAKLKCVILIPILSQTYCDPNCFAWQFELVPFNKMAAEDHSGKEVKLRGGNYASRILPIRIHDLEPEDIELFQQETGSVLRAMDFVFKTASGVNRPLKPDDNPEKNLNGTYYRDQVNKVAHAIKEIVTAIKKPALKGDLAAKAVEAASVSESVVELERSIAVLPFINDSSDQENTFFINGVMEEILNSLQRIKDLRVISRTSVEKFRGQNKSIPEIARELGVNYIVEGSGQKYGTAFRLRVQLIMAAKESHLWGESFQQKITEVEDIFNIQTQIAESIANELKAVISPEEKKRLEKIPSINLAVYEQYLKARSYFDFSRQSLYKALEFLNSGVEKSPDWAPLNVGLTEVWLSLQNFGYESPAVAGPKILENLNKAMELDPDISEVHYLNAWMALVVEWDWKKSEEEYLKALAINPNHSLARMFYSHLLAGVLHRYDEALAQAKLAFSLDPLNQNMKLFYAFTLSGSGDYKSSLALAEEILATDPDNILAHNVNAFAALGLKDYDKLLKSENYGLANIMPIEQDFFDEIHRIFKESGIVPAYKEILRHLEKFAESNYVPFLDMTYRYIIAEQPDKAMDWIEKGYELHDPNLIYISSKFIVWDPLYSDPRFIAICEKMNLPFKNPQSHDKHN